MENKIVINTIGTLGDLHPLIAVAQELKSAGLEPVFATSHDHIGKIRNSGFQAHGIVDGHLKQAADLGISETEFMHKMMTNQKEMMENSSWLPCPVRLKNLSQWSMELLL